MLKISYQALIMLHVYMSNDEISESFDDLGSSKACRPNIYILTLFRSGGGRVNLPPLKLSQISEKWRRPKACAFFH